MTDTFRRNHHGAPSAPLNNGDLDVTWTTEFPTKIGFYWIRNLETIWDEPDRKSEWKTSIVEVLPSQETHGQLAYFFTADASGVDLENVRFAEWYGPIDPPE